MTRLFVSGTDTEVGKTWVSAFLLRSLAARGRTTLGLKLFASGCIESPTELIAEDADLLRAASSVPVPDELYCPYRFVPAQAPGLCAEQTGLAIDFDRLAAAAARATADFILVEGAGGLYCPLGHGRTVADFAARLGYPLLVVARSSLGTINHCLLTVEAARRRGLAVCAVVLNDPTGTTPAASIETNAEQIARYGQVPVFTHARLFADAEAAK